MFIQSRVQGSLSATVLNAEKALGTKLGLLLFVYDLTELLINHLLHRGSMARAHMVVMDWDWSGSLPGS